MEVAISDFASRGTASKTSDYSNYVNQHHQNTNLYSGTGGELTHFFSISISGEEETVQRETPHSEIINIIDYITSCFNLTKNELAGICQIDSRKTVYNWLDGTSTPRTPTMNRLFDLLMIAKAWRQANLPNERRILSQRVFQGKNVYEILKENVLDRQKILFVGSRLILLNPLNKSKLKDPFA